MQDWTALEERLMQLDGCGYGGYKSLQGHDYGKSVDTLSLGVDKVQADPFASPSRFHLYIPSRYAVLPLWAYATPLRQVVCADHLLRLLHQRLVSQESALAKSVVLQQPGPQILARTGVVITPHGDICVRMAARLPGRGRRIDGRAAWRLLGEGLVRWGLDALADMLEQDGPNKLKAAIHTAEDAEALREGLQGCGLVGFVADGAILPRRSQTDTRPFVEGIPMQAPQSLAVTLPTPHSGDIRGLGIPRGITLICGGGYHGKSTLLRALEHGVYNHIAGDGRERVVACDKAVKVRAEDGRAITGCDISNFIGSLPQQTSTQVFSSALASGSTSQAAAIVEALEVGAECLLVDEDTSATNFMMRDRRMQALILAEHEPITPFVDRARSLFMEEGVSSVLVIGGAGDYLDIADTVIGMIRYMPQDLSDKARRIVAEQPSARMVTASDWKSPTPRTLAAEGIEPMRGRRAVSIKLLAQDRVAFGEDTLDLAALSQLVEGAQSYALAWASVWVRERLAAEHMPWAKVLDEALLCLQNEGLAFLAAHGDHREMVLGGALGDLSAFRIFELQAFLSRLPTLRVCHEG